MPLYGFIDEMKFYGIVELNNTIVVLQPIYSYLRFRHIITINVPKHQILNTLNLILLH